MSSVDDVDCLNLDSIHFSDAKWARVKGVYEKLWERTLDRPVIAITTCNHESNRAKPKYAYDLFTCNYPAEATVADIIDSWDYNFSTKRYLGDAFPQDFPNYGAGVGAAFLGCDIVPAPESETAWFVAQEAKEIEEYEFKFDPENKWLKIVAEVTRAAKKRWQGKVVVGMTDIGGVYDILSAFRPSSELLLDLYDCPDEVKAASFQVVDAWKEMFMYLNNIAQEDKVQGYTCVTPIYSQQSYYILQSDFCYMLSPDMFEEFIKPELSLLIDFLDNPFYHLDGAGQLAHLDSLLSIEKLRGIQWVPGAGAPDCLEWPEVYKKIHDSGKILQFYGSQIDSKTFESVEIIADQIGSTAGIVAIFHDVDKKYEDEAYALLEKFGVEP